MSGRLYLNCLVLLILSLSVFAFDFSFTPPTSCDYLNISWSGGKAPFTLLITPFLHVPRNMSIPDSAVDPSSGNGSFSLQLDLTPSQNFILTMSDSTGFGSGGTSGVLTVGSPVSDATCDLPDPKPDFIFALNPALQQCRTSTFSSYDNATQPVKILGLIPLGQSFELDPSLGSSSFDWTADVTSGTSITFIMIDSLGRQGGSSLLKFVDSSNDSSCLSDSSPHSTAQASSTDPGATSTQTGATSTQTGATSTNTGASQATVGTGSNAGAIAGATIGGVALLSIAAVTSFCCCRRRRSANNDHAGPSITFVGSHSSRVGSSLLPFSSRIRRAHSFDLLPPGASHHSSHHGSPLNQSTLPLPEDQCMPTPYILPSDAGAADGHSVTHLREPPSPVYRSPAGGVVSYARSHSRSHARTDTKGPVSPVSALPSPYSLGHTRQPSDPYSTSSASAGVTSLKASFAGTDRTTPRFILHRDADDVESVDDVSEPVELPPQYTDRRGSNPKRDEDKESNGIPH